MISEEAGCPEGALEVRRSPVGLGCGSNQLRCCYDDRSGNSTEADLAPDSQPALPVMPLPTTLPPRVVEPPAMRAQSAERIPEGSACRELSSHERQDTAMGRA